MTRYDVHDDAVLEGTPGQVLQALVDEAQGRTSWLQPRVRMRQVGDVPMDRVGGVVEFVIPSKRHPHRETVRFTARVIGRDGDRQLTLRVFDGHFRGVEEWTFDPVDDSHTRVDLHWWMRPRGRLRLLDRFVDVAAVHSKAVQEGFSGVAAHLQGQQALG
jgi:hypothetical protein